MGAPAGRLGVAGQASIEFVLLLAVALLVLHTLVFPNYFLFQNVMHDTQQLSTARLGAQELAKAINDVSAGGTGGKRTVRLLITENIAYGCGYQPTADGTYTEYVQHWYPQIWGPQRLTYSAILSTTSNPPVELPFNDNCASNPQSPGCDFTGPPDPFFDTGIRNGGGCELQSIDPDGDGTFENYLHCLGSIPVNANCAAINAIDFEDDPNTRQSENDEINLCHTVYQAASDPDIGILPNCGSQTHTPYYALVEITKQSDGSVAIDSRVEGS